MLPPLAGAPPRPSILPTPACPPGVRENRSYVIIVTSLRHHLDLLVSLEQVSVPRRTREPGREAPLRRRVVPEPFLRHALAVPRLVPAGVELGGFHCVALGLLVFFEDAVGRGAVGVVDFLLRGLVVV
eukprot:CAMPEP_0180230048 /NCGR_PEP_ID=MMETSP0987-20121128/25935_1 /TAXON_ID=697907 /ORGANISM="non described non described, Strain CCMP2293" /LENGTH=127 /DNA_ID=CAMNT_0022194975 /DNA_START=342 /DNA_END=725 /DNA_ORIENTATION=-